MATTQRPIPATTDEACFRYETTTRSCQCPDRIKRDGGTYVDAVTREAICKHIHHRRCQAEKVKERAIANIDRRFAKPLAWLSASNPLIDFKEYAVWLDPA